MKLHYFLFAGLLALLSCNEFLDIKPTDTLLTQAAFDTPQELESALTGVYQLVKGINLAGRNWLLFSDLLADNARVNSHDFQAFTQLELNSVHPYVAEMWETSYRAINQLNEILAAEAAVGQAYPGFAAEGQTELRGEASFLRAVIYFYLVRYFARPYAPEAQGAPGVPLVLEPVLNQTQLRTPPRASIGAVYAQIQADLQRAREDLSATEVVSGKPGGTAATAYLAKLAFQQGYWAEADSLAAAVLDGPHRLNTTPQAFFREEGSAEEIWCTVASPGETTRDGLYWVYYLIAAKTQLGAADYRALLLPRQQEDLAQAGYRALDLRGPTGDFTADPLLSADYLTSFKYDEEDLTDDAPLLRLAEMILLRAETAARLDRPAEAVEALNQIRRRAFRVLDSEGNPLPDPAPWIDYRPEDFTPEELLDAIARERRIELAFEGNYLHDLTRRRVSVRPGVDWDDPRLILPIPQRELDVNPNLEQNPGY